MTRRAHVPNDVFRSQVKAFCGLGMTHDQIAKMLQISDETLRKYYREELDIGAAEMNTQVASNLFSIATGTGNSAVSAAIFWLKTRGGWKEPSRVEVTGADGGPIETAITVIDPVGLSQEQRYAIKSALQQIQDSSEEQ